MWGSRFETTSSKLSICFFLSPCGLPRMLCAWWRALCWVLVTLWSYFENAYGCLRCTIRFLASQVRQWWCYPGLRMVLLFFLEYCSKSTFICYLNSANSFQTENFVLDSPLCTQKYFYSDVKAAMFKKRSISIVAWYGSGESYPRIFMLPLQIMDVNIYNKEIIQAEYMENSGLKAYYKSTTLESIYALNSSSEMNVALTDKLTYYHVIAITNFR